MGKESVRMESAITNKWTGNKWTSRIVRMALVAGIAYFGFIFPDSLSDHEKLLHFAAHVGMSFLAASFIYIICNIKFRIRKAPSLIILISSTTVIGIIYKYWEISSQETAHLYTFGDLLTVTGCYTSLSQNTAGILAAILMIEYVYAYLLPMRHNSLFRASRPAE
jgi:ABC-type branched-subunit amino acid transport system permease subunit